MWTAGGLDTGEDDRLIRGQALPLVDTASNHGAIRGIAFLTSNEVDIGSDEGRKPVVIRVCLIYSNNDGVLK